MAQTFRPDNVTVLQQKDGTIPLEKTTTMIQEVIANSVVMRLGKYMEMDGMRKKFSMLTGGGGAYWVNETQKIPTAPAKWIELEMEAKKMAVIVPVSNEYLRYGLPTFFEKMKPYITKAFYKKFDEAVILGYNNPFKQSIARSIMNANQNITGVIDRDAVFMLEDKIYENDLEVNAFISKNKNISALRKASLSKTEQIDTGFYKRISATEGELDGFPTVNLNSVNMPENSLIAGNFNHLYYGIPMQMEYTLLDQSQLSTIVNEDGSPVNLAEQDMKALRVIMHVGCLITKDEAFAGLNIAPDGNVYETMPGKDKVLSADPDAQENTAEEAGGKYKKKPAPKPTPDKPKNTEVI